jgi:hypothetical protein
LAGGILPTLLGLGEQLENFHDCRDCLLMPLNRELAPNERNGMEFRVVLTLSDQQRPSSRP